MNHAVNQYLAKIRKELIRSGDHDLKYYAVFAQEVEGFLAEKGQATLDELESYFGSVDKVIDDFLDTQPGEELRRKYLRRRKSSYVLRVVLVVLLAVIALFVVIRVIDGLNFSHGYSVRRVYEGTPPPSTESYVKNY